LKNWCLNRAGSEDRHLASLCLYGYLSKESEIKAKVKKISEEIIERNISRPKHKFNVLNDPEQLFCTALFGELTDQRKKDLLDTVRKSIYGRLTRKILLIAALIEFGEKAPEIPDLTRVEDIEEIILGLWFVERYRNIVERDVIECWRLFEKIYPSIVFGGEMGYNLSCRNLAFLYEAVNREIVEPDPNMLFDLYPLHPEIKKVSEPHFKNKKYPSAVFQALQKLEELINETIGIKDIYGVQLIKDVMNPKKIVDKKPEWKNPEELIVHFNEFLDEIHGRNEQEGLALISEGILKAFRHPKGHKPEDHPMIEMDPYEALGQLITIDYIWRRIQTAKILEKNLIK